MVCFHFGGTVQQSFESGCNWEDIPTTLLKTSEKELATRRVAVPAPLKNRNDGNRQPPRFPLPDQRGRGSSPDHWGIDWGIERLGIR